MVQRTLDRMAGGGVYDQIGGGFHRYAVDAVWLVPHFEKMLHDNAQLASVYLAGYQTYGNDRYRQVAEETLDFVARELTHPEGGFFATLDADTAGTRGCSTPGRAKNWMRRLAPRTPRSRSCVQRRARRQLRRAHGSGRSAHRGRCCRPPRMTETALIASLAPIKQRLLRVREQRSAQVGTRR